ncbi:polysaccharide deacetylase, partial [Turicibacter sanguinis]|nr:polysaccharide deacetylase [Turicibacter sanguinis]
SNTVILFHEKDITVQVLPVVIQYYLDLGYEFLPYNPDNHIVKNLFGSSDL